MSSTHAHFFGSDKFLMCMLGAPGAVFFLLDCVLDNQVLEGALELERLGRGVVGVAGAEDADQAGAAAAPLAIGPIRVAVRREHLRVHRRAIALGLLPQPLFSSTPATQMH